MTIEQKAKAYDKALEKAKDFYKDYEQRDNQLYADDLESIFPELKESGGGQNKTKVDSKSKGLPKGTRGVWQECSTIRFDDKY